MSASIVPSARFATDEFVEDEQFDAWRERISVIFNVAPLGNSKGFLAEADAFHLGELVMVRTKFAAQRFVRTQKQLRADWLDHYLVQYYRDGGYCGEAGSNEIEILPGTVSILDLAQPIDTRAVPAECLSLVVPRDVMDSLVPNADHLHGVILDPNRAGLLADYLGSLQQRLPGLANEQAPHVARATCELMAACIRPSAENLERAQTPVEALLVARIRRFIDDRIGSPELTPDAICCALHLSRTRLYELFSSTGGVRKYIQSRRLQRMHAALSDPNERVSIMVLAERCGFGSHSHVSHAFREHFGYSPSDVRHNPATAMHRHAGSLFTSRPHAPDEGPGFDDWVRGLRN